MADGNYDNVAEGGRGKKLTSYEGDVYSNDDNAYLAPTAPTDGAGETTDGTALVTPAPVWMPVLMRLVVGDAVCCTVNHCTSGACTT